MTRGRDWHTVLRVRLTSADYAAVCAAAKAMGQSPEQFARLATLQAIPPPARSPRGWVLRAQDAVAAAQQHETAV